MLSSAEASNHKSICNGVYSILDPRTLIRFVTGRARRGGMRLLAQLIAGISVLFVLFHLASGPLSDRYDDLFLRLPHRKPDSDSLRIVVFGSQDIMGSAARGTAANGTWTSKLCEKVGKPKILGVEMGSDHDRSWAAHLICRLYPVVMRRQASHRTRYMRDSSPRSWTFPTAPTSPKRHLRTTFLSPSCILSLREPRISERRSISFSPCPSPSMRLSEHYG